MFYVSLQSNGLAVFTDQSRVCAEEELGVGVGVGVAVGAGERNHHKICRIILERGMTLC